MRQFLAIGVVMIFLAFALGWVEMPGALTGTLGSPGGDVVCGYDGSASMKVQVLQSSVAVSQAAGVCYSHMSSDMINACGSETWDAAMRYGDVPPVLLSATWKGVDISDRIILDMEEDLINGWTTCVNVDSGFVQWMEDNGELDSSTNLGDVDIWIGYSVNNVNLCTGVVCDTYTKTCDDGSTATCVGSCLDGECFVCIPDCGEGPECFPSFTVCPDGAYVECENTWDGTQCSSCIPDCSGNQLPPEPEPVNWLEQITQLMQGFLDWLRSMFTFI